MQVKRSIQGTIDEMGRLHATCPFCQKDTKIYKEDRRIKPDCCEHFVCKSNGESVLFKGDETIKSSDLWTQDVKNKIQTQETQNERSFHVQSWETVADSMIDEMVTDTILNEPTKFILAGNATFTALNTETKNRFTFKVRKPEENTPHFVSVLYGQNNVKDYRYLGTIFDGTKYAHGKKSTINADAQSARVFKWLWNKLRNGGLPECVKIYHEGNCGKCGRKLTVPASIEQGFGPECINYV
jgi:hypothetical protein